MGKPGPKKSPSAVPAAPPPDWIAAALLTTLHIVCPLLFFTNLNRNPYYTQIVLLNLAICLGGIVWIARAFHANELRLPRTAIEVPLAGFLAVALLSSVSSWL